MIALIIIIIFLIGICLLIIFSTMHVLNIHNMERAKINRYYHIMVEWVRRYQEDKTVNAYLTKYNYKTVAIYGMKEMGELLFNDLIKHNVNVLYVVDRDESISVREGIVKHTPDDNLPDVDVMIVTAVFFYEEIKTQMKDKGMTCDVVSLEDVIGECI